MQLSLHLISSPLATLSNINTMMMMALGEIKYLSIMFMFMLTSTLSNHHRAETLISSNTIHREKFSTRVIVWMEKEEDNNGRWGKEIEENCPFCHRFLSLIVIASHHHLSSSSFVVRDKVACSSAFLRWWVKEKTILAIVLVEI